MDYGPAEREGAVHACGQGGDDEAALHVHQSRRAHSDRALPDRLRLHRRAADALVVETTGFKPMEAVRVDFGLLVYVSSDAKVTERFTLQDNDTIFYQFTVEDRVAYTQPWKGELTFRRTPDRIYEYACHEGNYSVPHILAGARGMERTGRKAAVTGRTGRLHRPEPNTP